jgi:hypothetical protein
MEYYVWEDGSVSGTWYPIKNCITDNVQGNKITSVSHIPPPVFCRGEVHSVTPCEILLSAVTVLTSYFFFLQIFGSSLVNYHLIILIYRLRYGRWAQQRTKILRNSLNWRQQYENRCSFHTARDSWKHEVTRNGRCVALLATRRPYSVRFVSEHAPLRDITSLGTGLQLAACVWLSNSYIYIVKST